MASEFSNFARLKNRESKFWRQRKISATSERRKERTKKRFLPRFPPTKLNRRQQNEHCQLILNGKEINNSDTLTFLDYCLNNRFKFPSEVTIFGVIWFV